MLGNGDGSYKSLRKMNGVEVKREERSFPKE
jgi:hypothetical protein